MTNRTDFEAIVLGLGGIGSGALYWLARRLGDKVLGIEQFELGHEEGGSHDHSRIIRYSYHRQIYVELAKRAYEAWHEVERDSGETLVYEVGGLDLFPEGGLIPLSDYTKSLEAAGIAKELKVEGWLGGNVALELWSYRPNRAYSELFQAEIEREGVRAILDG